MAHSRSSALAQSLALVVALASGRAAAAPPAEPRDTQPPSTPLGVTAVAASPSQIVLAWVASTDDVGVAGYEVFRGDEQVVYTADLTATESGLLPWREYCYRVRAYDKAGKRSEPSQPACAKTLDAQPPTTPTDVAVNGLSETEVEITWSPSRDDVGVVWYEVWREARGTVVAVEATRASERFLQPWTEYCYTVRARDDAGNWSPMSKPACARTPERNPPTAPPDLVARAKSDTEIELSWGDSTDDFGVVRYEVSRDGARFAQGATTRTHQGGLKPAREYCYEVVAVDGAGNRSKPSRACAATPDLQPPTAPTELAVAAASATEIVLEWKPSVDDVGVVSYEVLRGEKVVAQASDTFANEPALSSGKEQCYRVRALDAAGNRSQEAGPVCATTSADPQLPSAPRRVRAYPIDKGVALEWDAPPRSDFTYRVMWERDRTIATTRGTRLDVVGIKAGEKHCYHVASMDAAGRVSAKSLPVCAERPAKAPAATAVSAR